MHVKDKKVCITDVTFRDANQSLLATRIKIDDLLPIADKMDQVGFHSLETWGGATFDSCIRFLNEDPWERLRLFKEAMPNTPQQMLLRGQNLLGYRNYADDVVCKFVERAAECGMDIFRIFDALNDVRNLKTAVQAIKSAGKHAQGTMCFTTSPIHNFASWVELAKQIEDLGVHSICVKDMSGLLDPYYAYKLIKELKANTQLPIHLHTHSTTGFSVATLLKAVEAGIDVIDTATGSMSMTYGHAPTSTMLYSLKHTSRSPELNLDLIQEIDNYFRNIRRKYAEFEGTLRGIDGRILSAQVPGGMLTNMENQLKEQNSLDKFDDVLAEIPKVREDLGFIPLVTPTSQIVGTQAVLNVLQGKRYKLMTKETSGVLLGHYGKTPGPVNLELQQIALKKGGSICTKRPADLIENEWKYLCIQFQALLETIGLDSTLYNTIDNILIYVLFPSVSSDFLKLKYGLSTEEQRLKNTSTTTNTPVPKNLFWVELNNSGYVFEMNNQGDIKKIIPLN